MSIHIEADTQTTWVDPRDWFREHYAKIEEIIQRKWRPNYQALQMAPAFGIDTRDLQRMDPNLYAIGEMPLCRTWDAIAEEIELPQGFQKVEGFCRYDAALPPARHMYLERVREDGVKEWFCHMSPQFIRLGETIRRGGRIDALAKRAQGNGRPDLVSIIGSYAIVFGEASAVQEVLGLTFFAKTTLI